MGKFEISFWLSLALVDYKLIVSMHFIRKAIMDKTQRHTILHQVLSIIMG